LKETGRKQKPGTAFTSRNEKPHEKKTHTHTHKHSLTHNYLSCSPKEIGQLASKMLGYKLKTKQTPGDGVLVNKVKRVGVVSPVMHEYFFYFLLLLYQHKEGI
jgi:hypothetical protein